MQYYKKSLKNSTAGVKKYFLRAVCLFLKRVRVSVSGYAAPVGCTVEDGMKFLGKGCIRRIG